MQLGRLFHARHLSSKSYSAGDGHSGAQQEPPKVHGVVHRITPRQWQHIQETEGAAGHSEYGYAAVLVPVRTYDGRSLEAYTLVCQPKSVAFLKVRGAPAVGARNQANCS